MDLRHGDDFDQRVGYAIEVEELCRGRVFLGFGGILLQLDLLDVYANPAAIFRGDPVVVIKIDPSIARKWLCKPLASFSLIDKDDTNRSIV